jgi:serine protease Do
MNTRIAEELRAPNTKGVFVYKISPTSDAYAAGIRQYDVIVSFNNTSVEDASHFMRLLSDAAIGSTVNVSVFRGGKTVATKVPIVQSTPGRRNRR